MIRPEHPLPADRPEWDVLYRLLTVAADVIEGDDQTLTEDLLKDGAVCECQTWGLPETEAASWVIREARYRIACSIALRPRHRDDPLITTVIEILGTHPPAVQARILRATAHHLPGPLVCPRFQGQAAVTDQDITDPAT